MDYKPIRQPLRTLIEKLQLVANGYEQELTPEEALIYAVDYADQFPDELINETEVNNG